MAHFTLAIRTVALRAVALAALASTPVLTAPQGQQPVLPGDDASIRHVLNRLGFGARPGDVDRVRHIGLGEYIDLQLHPDRVLDDAMQARLGNFTTLTLSSEDIAEQYFLPALQMRRQQQAVARTEPAMTTPPAAGTPVRMRDARRAVPGPQRVAAELMQARLLRAIESERQLQEVLTDFWMNHFNVFIGKNMVRPYVTAYERDAIRPHVLGSFRDMLGAVAKSPAMLVYLDNWQSAAEGERTDLAEVERRLNNSRLTPAARQRLATRLQQMRQRPRPSRGLNENYARELLELHTLGVDGGYTQADVVSLARIFTGWTIDQPRQGGGFVFRSATHDSGTKTLLGQVFGPAGQAEGEFALDLLAAHRSTARHIATKLVQRFVSDTPPDSLVDRVAQVFLDTKGDLREVVRAVVTSPEFFAPEARHAKVKTPLEFVVSAARATGAAVEDAQVMVATLQSLGMPLYGSQPPTGYGTAASDWVNTGALLARMNFAVDLVAGGPALRTNGRGQPAATGNERRPGAARQTRQGAPVRIDITALAPDTGEAARAAVIRTVLGDVASDTTRDTLARAGSPEQLVALALGSPEFQRR